MTSYIQTTAAPVQQERPNNLQTLNSWVLPLSLREEAPEITNNGAKWSSDLLSLSSTKDCTSSSKAIVKKPKFSTKNSLDMCTETLGSENGTMYSTDDDKRDNLLSNRVGFLTQEGEEEAAEEEERRRIMMIKRVRSRTDHSHELPPVLTSRRTGESFVSIVRERADGRMVMYAVQRQMAVTAERSGGRLKLRLLSSAGGCSDHDDHEREEIRDDEGVEGDYDYLGVVGKEMNGKENGGEEVEGKKYVFVGRCYKEGEKRDGWTPLMVASAI